MSVLRYDNEEVIGHVVDLIVHPTEGRVVALFVATPSGRRRVIAATDFVVRGEVVLAEPYSDVGGDELREMLASGVLAGKRLVGMEVVTEQRNNLGYVSGRGRYIGFIRDVYLLPRSRSVVYHLGDARSRDGAQYLAGSVPCAYSRTDHRIEVPRQTERRFMAASPREAAERAEPEGAAVAAS